VIPKSLTIQQKNSIMKTQKKLAAKLLFTKQTVAKLNEDAMMLMRGGAAGPAGEGLNFFDFTVAGTFNCGSTGDITCNTATANPNDSQ